MSDIDGLIEACRIHAAHNYTSPDAASVLRRAADALASERGRVGEHDTELAEWRRMAASPHDLEVAKTCWLQDKFAAERKVAGLEAQVALDTGNIERMREAGEKAERKVDRLREALDSLLAEEKGIAYLFKIAGSIPPDSFTDACMQARAALAEDGAVQSAMALKCEWKQDDDGIYHTGCGEAFTFDSGTATENKAKFCQYCGGNLRAVPFAEEGGK